MISGRSRSVVVLACMLCMGTSMLSCESDDPVTTGVQLGDSPNPARLLPGTYTARVSNADCGQPLDLQTSSATNFVLCGGTEFFEDFFEFQCDPIASGDSLIYACTVGYDPDQNPSSPCWQGVTVIASLHRVGELWVFRGQLQLSDCDGSSSCSVFSISFERTGDAPSGCEYAPYNRLDGVITGGRDPGYMFANGDVEVFGNETGRNYSVLAGGTIVPLSVTFEFSTPIIDPADLPVTVDIIVFDPTPQRVTGVANETFMQYQETRIDDADYIYEAKSGAGSMTFFEASGTHVAGTFTVDMVGEEFDGASTVQTTRGFVGGFFVELRKPAQEVSTHRGWLLDMLQSAE